MSAFQVSPQHIAAIVELYFRGPALADGLPAVLQARWRRLDGFEFEVSRTDPIAMPEPRPSLAEQLFMVLARENVRSLDARYPMQEGVPHTTPAERPAKYKGWRRPTIVEGFAILDCYEYQSSEHAGWETSQARKVVDGLRAQLIRALPGYNAAPWGWEQVPGGDKAKATLLSGHDVVARMSR